MDQIIFASDNFRFLLNSVLLQLPLCARSTAFRIATLNLHTTASIKLFLITHFCKRKQSKSNECEPWFKTTFPFIVKTVF
jgi:hypothetical protein